MKRRAKIKSLKKWQKALIGIAISIGDILLLFIILCVVISIKSVNSSNYISNEIQQALHLSQRNTGISGRLIRLWF